MPELQTFDAFYAATVQGVTRKMHDLAGDDPKADHAIREAYAQAYQQWFEVSGYRDAEGWVFDAARQAYERRRAQAGPAASTPQATDASTSPGPHEAPGPALGPEATVTGPIGLGPGGPRLAQEDPPLAGTMPAATRALQPGGWQAGPSGGGPARPGAGATPGRPAGSWSLTGLLNRPGAGTVLIAVLAVVALAAASIAAYLAFGPKPAAGHGTTPPEAVSKPHLQMLPAGQVGPRSAVPWSLLGPGWVLAEESSAAPDSAGQPSGGGTITTYLVDPKGGRYLIQQWSATSTPTLVAWSGNADTALYVSFTSGSTAPSYSLQNLPTGQITQLTLPAGVSVAGFTRPDGLNLVAVQQGPLRYKLQRYSLTGALAAQLSYMPVRGAQPSLATCGIYCGALSSPDGLAVVWAMGGDEMQLVSNRGGIVRRLHVPGSGSPPSCSPIRWLGGGVILASCAAPGPAGASKRLWLVPVDGAAPTALTPASGGPSGSGFYTSAWPADGSIYVTATSPTQCPQAPTGPGGINILRLGAGGTDTPVTVPGTTGNHNMIVGSGDGRLLVLAQTSCPGTTSLLVFDPADGASHVVLTGPAGQSGVIAAVALGTS